MAEKRTEKESTPYGPVVTAAGAHLDSQNRVINVPAETKVFRVDAYDHFLSSGPLNPDTPYGRSVMEAANYMTSPEYKAAIGKPYAVRVGTKQSDQSVAMSAVKTAQDSQLGPDTPINSANNEVGRRVTSLADVKARNEAKYRDQLEYRRSVGIPDSSRPSVFNAAEQQARATERFFTPAGRSMSARDVATYLHFGLNSQSELGFGGQPGMAGKGVAYQPRYIRVAAGDNIMDYDLRPYRMYENFDPLQSTKNISKLYGQRLGAELSSYTDNEIYIPRRMAYDPNVVQEVGFIRHTPGDTNSYDIVVRRPPIQNGNLGASIGGKYLGVMGAFDMANNVLARKDYYINAKGLEPKLAGQVAFMDTVVNAITSGLVDEYTESPFSFRAAAAQAKDLGRDKAPSETIRPGLKRTF